MKYPLLAMYLCQRQGDMRLADIANRFGFEHYASAVASIRQFQKRLNDNRKLYQLVNAIKLDLTLTYPRRIMTYPRRIISHFSALGDKGA